MGCVCASERATSSALDQIKLSAAQHYLSNGKSRAEAEALGAGLSGHSMRAGYATTAGELDEAG